MNIIPFLRDNWISILAILTSFLALLTSFFILYREHLKQFSLVIKDAGRVVLVVNPHSINLNQHSVMLDIILNNTGAKSGVVEDIALLIFKENDSPTIFRSKFSIMNKLINFTNAPITPEMETFTSFNLKGKESAVKRIMFVPKDLDTAFSFKTSTYVLELYARTTNQPDWKKYFNTKFSVSDEDLKVLARITTKPEGGGYYFTWYQQEKTTDIIEENLKLLPQKQN